MTVAGSTRRWHPDRPRWRRALAFFAGPCWHLTHRQDECTATFQRVWSDDELPLDERTSMALTLRLAAQHVLDLAMAYQRGDDEARDRILGQLSLADAAAMSTTAAGLLAGLIEETPGLLPELKAIVAGLPDEVPE